VLARRDDGSLVLAGEPLAADARLVVVAAGKAAAPMAAALEAAAGGLVAAGCAVTKDGHGVPLARVALREAGHPVPDARSESAGRAVLRLAASARPEDVLVVLLSGGASALLACPLDGLGREDVAAATALLLRAGAGIDELNAVRKHLTALSGGRLALASPAGRIEVLAVSDVPGDDPAVLGSGPCAADRTRYADAVAIAHRRGVWGALPERVRTHLDEGARGRRPESAKPGDPRLARVRTTLLASNRDALEAAAAAARGHGRRPLLVTGALRGEARVAGRRLAALGLAARAQQPLLLLAGGETTVTVRGDGRGGRSQELALAAALALDGHAGVALLAAGTDGSDGPTDAAGAFADGGTLARGRTAGADARAALARNDAYGFFAIEAGLVVTGPTRTNVMDLVLLAVGPDAGGG
jgi:glycerate-2-kinase